MTGATTIRGTVETVRGPIPLTHLGRTLMHEHIFVLTPEVQTNLVDFDDDIERPKAVAQLQALHQAGIDTIVDPTVIGLGRYIPRILEVAAEVEINIIAATGLYTYNDVPHYFRFRDARSSPHGRDPMVDLFAKEITEGIAETSVKAAFLKCATDADGLTSGVERVLRAVAQAHCLTGAPILTHTDPHQRRGLDQLRIFKEEGVDLSKVVIGHCGDTDDRDYLDLLLSEGVTLGMDRFGLDLLFSFERRVGIVASLCREGYASQLVLAHDAACYIDWMPREARSQLFPQWHYLHIPNDVVPALKEAGVSDEEISTMLVDNPRAFFTPNPRS